MTARLNRLLVFPNTSVRDVMTCIDRNTKGIALVVDQDHRLIGTVTDGDIRRAILNRVDLDLPIQSLLKHREKPPYLNPLTASVGTSSEQLLSIMKQYGIRHVPIVDRKGCIKDIALLADLVKKKEPPLTTVIMAGGYGTRLKPLTKGLPKPMLLVGQQPLLERIIKQLRKAGIRQLNISTHYKAEKITRSSFISLHN